MGAAGLTTSAMAPTAVVADEWALMRAGMASVLSSIGVRVEAETGRGRNVVQLVNVCTPDLVVVGPHRDISMVRLVRRLKRLPQPPRLAALLARPHLDDVRELLAGGADALLLRSAEEAELAGALTLVLDGERVVTPALQHALVGSVTPAGQPGEGVLSPREFEVLIRLSKGGSNPEIAADLYVTVDTVKTHLARVYTKLGARNRHEALARGVALGLLA